MANTTSVGNLSLNITAQITRALNAVDKLTVSLGKANQQLVLMGLQTGKIGTVATQPVKKLNDELGKTKKQADANTKALQTMSGTLSKVGQVFAYQIGFGSLQQSINTLKNIGVASFKEAIDFVENYNLFNVSFGGEVQESLKFQNQLNQAFAVNMSESLRYQGFFKNLTTSLGITNEASGLLSENLTKLTYDLSSLYNVQFVDMYTKLQSGMIGQTKPLRSVGIDVTQQTLQPYLYDMGINKKVTELTQAEKVLLRYIAILKQSSTAHGDFARTIETPANQLKILRDQIAELGRWFGMVFMGMFGEVLPYINAFVMVIKELMKSLAYLFGFDLSDYNFLGEQDDILGGVEDGFDNATSASESFKKSLMGFDEINNLSQSGMSNLSGPFLTGGYSSTYTKLLEEIKGYDNLMGSVKNKAKEVADKILELLGFQKQLNEETGDYVWVWGDVKREVGLFGQTVNNVDIDWGNIFKGAFKLFSDLSLFIMQVVGSFNSFLTNILLSFEQWVITEFVKIIMDIPKSMSTFYEVLKKDIERIFGVDIIGSFERFIKDSINKVIGFINELITQINKIPLINIPTIQTSGSTGISIGGSGTSGGGSWGGTTSTGTNKTTTTTTTPKTTTPIKVSADERLNKYTSVGMYASGGMPSVGEMFIARESGAELVGSIGSRSAVMNNDQIVQAVSQGVAQAVASVMNSDGSTTVNLVVNDDVFGRAIIKSANRTMKNTNLVLDI